MQAWIKFKWNDYRLSWNSTNFGGIESLRINPQNLWIPDITLYNLAGCMNQGSNSLGMNIDPNVEVLVYSSGDLLYIPRAHFQTYCAVNYENWPWGDQNCTFKAGSWTYDMENIDIQPYMDKAEGEESPVFFEHFINKNQVRTFCI